MKNKILPLFRFLILSLALIMSSFSAMAENKLTGTYYGIQFANSNGKLENSLGTTETSYGHIKGKYGWVLNDVVSLEGQLGITNTPEGAESLMIYGAYLRAGKNFGDYKLYGLLGLGGIYSYDADDKESESGGSYGFGVEIFGSKQVAISLEYLVVLNKSVDAGDLTFDSIGIGYSYYFSDDKSYFDKNRNKIKSIRY
jgi:hypothetical protein